MPSLDRVRKLCTNEKLESERKAAASPPKKETNPASLRSAAPSKGRGSRGYSLLPLEGGAPKGRRLAWVIPDQDHEILDLEILDV